MIRPNEILSINDIEAIHNTTLDLLNNVGIIFHSDEAIETFKKHGLKTDGNRVFINETTVMAAVNSAPSSFTVRGRNPDRDVVIGGGRLVMAPGYGAPFVIDREQGKRRAKLEDYQDLIRLAHSLPNQDLSGYLLVQPADIPGEDAHLRMLYAGMVHSDKPFLGSSEGALQAEQTMEMASILFDEAPEKIKEQPVTLALVDSLSPLSYSADMAETIMAYARWRQPVIMASLVIAGATGPVTLAGSLAQQNAELLAGIVLAQIVSPGTPVIYASASTNMDLRTGSLAIGSPELSLMSAVSIQLASFYDIPSRGGGALTDSNSPDAQAGYESMFALLNAARSGSDFILHAAGILSSFLAFSYEKFVLDDDMCGMVRHFHEGISVEPETLAYDVIAKVGPGSNYLREPHTVKRCRSAFWQPAIADRDGVEMWMVNGRGDALRRAKERWQQLLEEHIDPEMDLITQRQLNTYLENHCS